MIKLDLDIFDVSLLGGGSVEQAIVCKTTKQSALEGSKMASGDLWLALPPQDLESPISRAKAAFRYGIRHYIDEDTGRVISAVDSVNGTGSVTDVDGSAVYYGEWSKHSVVSLTCPAFWEAVAFKPAIKAMILGLPIHHYRTDMAAWKKLCVELYSMEVLD